MSQPSPHRGRPLADLRVSASIRRHEIQLLQQRLAKVQRDLVDIDRHIKRRKREAKSAAAA